MVADDLALTSKCLYSIQTSIAIAEHDASHEQYRFNTDKTKFIAINTGHKSETQWQATHLFTQGNLPRHCKK